MAGGNTSSRKKPYRTTKDSAASYDNHALAGGKFYSPTMTGDSDYIDEQTGLPFAGPGNATPANVDGNDSFKSVDAGPGVVVDRAPKKAKGDATPGGGW